MSVGLEKTVEKELSGTNLPDPETVIDHEFGNHLQLKIPYTDSPETDNREIWEASPRYESDFESTHVIDSLNELKGRNEEGFVNEKYEEFSGPEQLIEEFTKDSKAPVYPRRVAFEGKNVIENSRKLSEPLSTDEETSLDYILSTFGHGKEEIYSDLDITVDCPEDDFYVRGGSELWLATHTIKKNWIDHGEGLEDYSELFVNVESEEDYVELDIYDNGPGLNGYSTEEIFEYGEGENTGLGLGMVKELVELNNGSVEYCPANAEKRNGMGYKIKLEKS